MSPDCLWQSCSKADFPAEESWGGWECTHHRDVRKRQKIGPKLCHFSEKDTHLFNFRQQLHARSDVSILHIVWGAVRAYLNRKVKYGAGYFRNWGKQLFRTKIISFFFLICAKYMISVILLHTFKALSLSAFVWYIVSLWCYMYVNGHISYWILFSYTALQPELTSLFSLGGSGCYLTWGHIFDNLLIYVVLFISLTVWRGSLGRLLKALITDQWRWMIVLTWDETHYSFVQWRQNITELVTG